MKENYNPNSFEMDELLSEMPCSVDLPSWRHRRLVINLIRVSENSRVLRD